MQSGSSSDDGPGRTDKMNDTDSKLSNARPTNAGVRSPKEKSVGDALRAVYHDAVDEQVPDSMLDLLSKLG